MNVFELTRALVDIESITNNEERVGNYLFDYLTKTRLPRTGGRVERMEVEAAPLQRAGHSGMSRPW